MKLKLLVVANVLILGACAAKPPAHYPDAQVEITGSERAEEGLLRDELANATYKSDWTQSGTAHLTNGEWSEPAAPGSATQTTVMLSDHISHGDLNDQQAAAAVLVTDPGGTGTFYDLALLVKGPEGWRNVAIALLGDRVKVHSLAIEDNEIVVDLTTHGPDDAMCCPTLQVLRRFALKDDQLTTSPGDAPEKTDEPIVGILWKWQQTVYNNDTKAVPPNPNQYTFHLLPDAKVSIRSDCNIVGGRYTLKGSQISIDILATTMAACPPGSLADEFIKDLNVAAIYFTQGDNLFIDLMYDTGTMRFSR
jgi:heat shock protein HslJ